MSRMSYRHSYRGQSTRNSLRLRDNFPARSLTVDYPGRDHGKFGRGLGRRPQLALRWRAYARPPHAVPFRKQALYRDVQRTKVVLKLQPSPIRGVIDCHISGQYSDRSVLP